MTIISMIKIKPVQKKPIKLNYKDKQGLTMLFLKNSKILNISSTIYSLKEKYLIKIIQEYIEKYMIHVYNSIEAKVKQK